MIMGAKTSNDARAIAVRSQGRRLPPEQAAGLVLFDRRVIDIGDNLDQAAGRTFFQDKADEKPDSQLARAGVI
jgi:hypothetical protein